MQLVPHSWVKEENGEIVCAWPPYRNITKLQNAIRNHEIPKSSWQWYAADIMKETCEYFSFFLIMNVLDGLKKCLKVISFLNKCKLKLLNLL